MNTTRLRHREGFCPGAGETVNLRKAQEEKEEIFAMKTFKTPLGIVCRLSFLLFLLLSFCTFRASYAEAGSGEPMYWHGDTNYPIWDSGSQFGSVVDRSSAYLVENDENTLDIALISFMVSYSEDSAGQQHIMHFCQDRTNDDIYYYSDDHPKRTVVAPGGVYNGVWKSNFQKVYNLILRDFDL